MSRYPAGMEARICPPALPGAIHLQAIDPSRNIARAYSIDARRDLFGHWIVALGWGRIGTSGQSRTLSFVHERDATRFIRTTLTRRASAKRRIGVDYAALG
jgi:predicted DNA-binding WGR domain protein